MGTICVPQLVSGEGDLWPQFSQIIPTRTQKEESSEAHHLSEEIWENLGVSFLKAWAFRQLDGA